VVNQGREIGSEVKLCGKKKKKKIPPEIIMEDA
jgi:hypothetical protein